MSIPRPEYPRPQFARADWLSLNGQWEFAVGGGGDGALPSSWAMPGKILVPFAPESSLSGIEETGFMPAVRYRRDVAFPASWTGSRVLVHFGAVDHDSAVYVDDKLVDRHRGGFTSFTVDITEALGGRSHCVLSVLARDDPERIQARGKQSRRSGNYEAFYTRTTGIWQSVWAEPVSDSFIRNVAVTPHVEDPSFTVDVDVARPAWPTRVEAELALDDGTVIASASVSVTQRVVPQLRLAIPPEHVRLWGPDTPYLYRTRFRLIRGDTVLDDASGYAGLRSVSIDGTRVLLNGAPVFQRLVLDQGYWPDGIMTAPDDDALVADIRNGIAAGFNGARLHQKVFEERYLYHADRLGYLVWAEFGDWGANSDPVHGDQRPTVSFVTEWLEEVTRDYSHPSIIGWCPLNETREPIGDGLTTLDEATRALYLATKAIDPTRPVLDASGYSHRVPGADVYDAHDYEQDPAAFREQMSGLSAGRPFTNRARDGRAWSVPYQGQPYFVSEFGGIWWSGDDTPGPDSWGYGAPAATREEWVERFRRLVDVLLDDPSMFGYCFTQLTDVFQEKNGIFDFQRRPKFDLAILRAIQTRPAAAEQEQTPQPAEPTTTSPAPASVLAPRL